MSTKYLNLRQNSPELKVCDNPREVIIYIVSCMCDNENVITMKKNSDGDFKMNGGRFSLSNYQMRDNYKIEAEWAADDNDWEKVFQIVNSGTSVIEKVMSR